MNHELIIVVLAALALLTDIVMSRLLTPKVRIAGQRSSLYEDENHDFDEYRKYGEAKERQSSTKSKAVGEEVHSETDSSQNAGSPLTESATQTADDPCSGVRVYQFAFQNDEAKELSWGGKAAIIQIAIRGAGSFWQCSCKRPMTDPSRYKKGLRGFLGPDEFPAQFTKDNKRIITPALPFCDLMLRAPKPRAIPRGYPHKPKTWGDRFRRRRMDLGLTQAGLAERIGRSMRAVAGWELGVSRPLASSWAGIAEVLGADLLPEGDAIGSRVRAARWRLGLTQVELAEKVGLDPRTIRNVEQGRYRPSRATLAKLGSVLPPPHQAETETEGIHHPTP